MSEEGYAGRKRWQHDGVSRQETPEAWSRHQAQGATSQRKGRANVEAQRNETWQPDTATCSLCGAWRGWLGLEPTVAMYVEHTIEVLRAIRRVMRKDGVCWWDLDDSRGGSNKGIMADGSAVGGPKQQTVGGSIDGGLPKAGGIPKSLCLIPQRVALAASEDGWIVRSQIIIPSWMPESARDRPTDAYRVVLMLCRSRKYWYDAAAVRVAQSYQKPADVFGHNDGQRRDDGRAYEGNAPDGLRSLGNIWADIPPSAYPAAHFATFPVEEPERCIKASCPAEVCVKCGKARVRITENKAMVIARSGRAEGAGCRTLPSGTMLEPPEQTTLGWTDCGCAAGWTPGLILDPFIGTGTTAVAAVKLGRRCIGIDASEEYLKQAVTRLTVGDAGVRLMVKAARAGAKQEVLL